MEAKYEGKHWEGQMPEEPGGQDALKNAHNGDEFFHFG